MRTLMILFACLANVIRSRKNQAPDGERRDSIDAFASLLFTTIAPNGIVRSPAHPFMSKPLMKATDKQSSRRPEAVHSTRRAIAKSIIVGLPAATLALQAPPAARADDLLEIAGNLATLLKPLYSLEAPLQAGNYDKSAVRAQIEDEISNHPVVVYSYTLSPFCTEAKTLLREAVKASKPDSAQEIKVIELGDEWLPGMLPAEGAAIRAELGAMTGQTSMPHIFIGGKSIGGLATGTPGLKQLIKSGRLQQKLNDATWQTVGASGGAVL
jgi:glutaredoxin-related protein